MNEFDQFIKHELKAEYYARYTDDFTIVAERKEYLLSLLPRLAEFLRDNLALTLHPGKTSVHALHRGVDFLGYVIFPKHRLLRTKTKRRMFKNMRRRINEYRAGAISEFSLQQTLQSYLGVLSHANAHGVSEELKNQYWFFLN